jgi:uncharacterized repeat protein (TIGR01451 family)
VDAGEAGNTITNVTTAATGNQTDPSTVGDDLEEAVVVVVDNTTDLVTVKTLESFDTTPGEGDIVTFRITIGNNGPNTATNVTLTDLLPAGLTATIDNGESFILDPLSAATATPGAYDAASGLWTVSSLPPGFQAVLFLEGTVDAGQGGNTITNITTAATGDQADPTTAGDDLTESVVVDSIINAEIGAAKQIVGSPTQLPNGNYEATYLVWVENTGNVDLANLTLTEDLSSQFGGAYVNAYGLTIVTAPTNANSEIYLNNANFNGGGVTQIVDTSQLSRLAVGDSFIFEFTVEIDASQATGVLENTVVATGDAVDGSGNPINDGSGNPIVVSDNSDSGSNPGNNNPGEPGDTGTPDDPTPLYIPSVGLSKEAGLVSPNGEYFDVEFTLTWENTGNTLLDHITLFDDVASQFGNNFVGIVPGSLAIQNFVGTGTPPDANAAWESDTTQDLFVENAPLHVGDTFEITYTVTIDPDAFGGSALLENQATSTSEALDENGDHLLDSSGGFIVASDDSDNGADPASENGSESTVDGTFANDPTPVYIPSLGLAKQAGDAVPNGENFDVTFTVLVENNGNVSLNDLTLYDDIRAQFGAPAIGVSNLTVANFTGTGFAPTVNTGWETDTTLSMVSGGQLDIGDAFEVSYTVTIDPDINNESVHLVNQAVGNGTATKDGNQLFDSSGNLLTATDASDNGTDANAENSEASPDGVFANDPTPVAIADLGVAKSVVGEPQLVNGNYLITFAATVENTGTIDLENLSLTEDLATQFGAVFVNASSVTLTSGTTNPSSYIALSSTFNGSSDAELLDSSVNNILHVGDSFSFEFVVEVDAAAAGQQLENHITASGDAIDESGNPYFNLSGSVLTAFDISDSGVSPNTGNGSGTTDDGTLIDIPLLNVPGGNDGTTSGNPPNLIGLPPIVASSIGNFLGSPGPIYSGIFTNTANPVTLESSRPITGGYSLDASGVGGGMQHVDCCQIADAVPGQPVVIDTVPAEMIQGEMIQGEPIQGDCGCEDMLQEAPLEVPCDVMLQPCGECQAPMEDCCCGCGDVQQDEAIHAPIPVQQQLNPSFLKRMRGWLSR